MRAAAEEKKNIMRRLQPIHLVTLLLCLAAATATQAQKIAISPEDKALVISGTLGSGATSFTRHITLTLVGGSGNDAKQVQIRRSDLVKYDSSGEKPDPSGELLDRGNLSVGAVALKPGQALDVPVTVNNVTHAGTYKATIKFWLPEQTETDAEVITLTLHVSPRVVVSPPTGSSAQVAHCGLLPCALSRWLPQSLVGNKRGLLVDNQTSGAVAVESHDVVLRGERTGRILTANDVRPSIESNSLPANHSVPVAMEILNLDTIPPDSYTGTLRLKLAGADTPTAVGYVLNVRAAPWLPILVLVLGVIAGRVVRNMSTPEALLQVKLLKRLFRLQDSVLALPSQGDRQILLGRLDDLKIRIESGRETEQALTQELDKLEVTARLLRRLDVLAREATQITNTELHTTIMSKIREATAKLMDGNAAQCTVLITEIEGILRDAQAGVADDEVGFGALGAALDSAADARATGEDAARVFRAGPAETPGRPARWLATLAGSELMS